MLQIIGIVVLFACVFGGFLISGGKLDSVIEAAPHEMLTIGGAALAALLIASSMYTLKKIGGDCTVESRLGGGTTVKIRLSLPVGVKNAAQN